MNIINGRIVDNDGKDITEDTGVVIKGNTGPVHLGDGDTHNDSPVFNGKGVTIVKGNSKGISKKF